MAISMKAALLAVIVAGQVAPPQSPPQEWWPPSAAHVLVLVSEQQPPSASRQDAPGGVLFYWRERNPLVLIGSSWGGKRPGRRVTVYSDDATVEFADFAGRWCAQQDFAVLFKVARKPTVHEGRDSIRHHWLSRLALDAYFKRPVEYTDAADRVLAHLAVKYDETGLPVEASGPYLDRKGSILVRFFYRPPRPDELPIEVPWIKDPNLPVKVHHSEECVESARVEATRRAEQKKRLDEKLAKEGRMSPQKNEERPNSR